MFFYEWVVQNCICFLYLHFLLNITLCCACSWVHAGIYVCVCVCLFVWMLCKLVLISTCLNFSDFVVFSFSCFAYAFLYIRAFLQWICVCMSTKLFAEMLPICTMRKFQNSAKNLGMYVYKILQCKYVTLQQGKTKSTNSEISIVVL